MDSLIDSHTYIGNIAMEVQAKIEQDAIVIDDDEMHAEEPVVAADNHRPPPGKTYFDLQIALCKQNNLEQDDPESVIMRRLVKFFEYNKRIEPGREYFTSRKQPEYSNQVEPIANELIIFGCDFKKLKIVKRQYETTSAVLINPSNFKLIYLDRGSAWNAIQKNAKDPSSLVKKSQSEDSPLPRCWFQMQPYTFHNRQIKVWVRFATEQERDIKPKEEEWLYIYNKCREVYNDQEQNLRHRRVNGEAKQRQKLECNKQKNSSKLYKKYEQENDKEWIRGKNMNPGAMRNQGRDNSRSRSRSKQKLNGRNHNQPGEGEINDKSSNYSFIMTKSKKDLKELNEAIDQLDIAEIPAQQKQKVAEQSFDLSFEIRKPEEENYNWNGSKMGLEDSATWSYSKYMEKCFEEEQMKKRNEEMKKQKISWVTIDD